MAKQILYLHHHAGVNGVQDKITEQSVGPQRVSPKMGDLHNSVAVLVSHDKHCIVENESPQPSKGTHPLV